MTGKKVHNILIVDDHALMRNGLEAMLASEPDYDVVGVAADGMTAIRSVSDLQPDIILMDLTMPRTSGIDAIVQIKRNDLNAFSDEAAGRIIEGTARSMGVEGTD